MDVPFPGKSKEIIKSPRLKRKGKLYIVIVTEFPSDELVNPPTVAFGGFTLTIAGAI